MKISGLLVKMPLPCEAVPTPHKLKPSQLSNMLFIVVVLYHLNPLYVNWTLSSLISLNNP